MYSNRFRPVLGLSTTKHEINNTDSNDGGGALSPDVRSDNLSLFSPFSKKSVVSKIGKYLVSGLPDDSFTGLVFACQAVHSTTGREAVCKVLPVAKYKEILSPYWVAGCHKNINNIKEIVIGSNRAYAFFDTSYGDLHSYVRKQRKLKDDEACRLFTQIVSAVDHCHENGVILRDLKLRKFVFKDSKCSHLVLDSLEDSYVLSNQEDDLLTDRHGCPAYVSPEILFSSGGYSGRSADVWSLGVVLYTMLAGQYPFHDLDVGVLFKKIRQGVFSIPERSTTQAKCLLKNLLRTDPNERLHTDEILGHVWFQSRPHVETTSTPRVQLISPFPAANSSALSLPSSLASIPPPFSAASVSLLLSSGGPSALPTVSALSPLDDSNSSSPVAEGSVVHKNPNNSSPDQTVPQISLIESIDFGNLLPMILLGSV